MSAWPEAVWVSKKLKAVINEVFDINEIVTQNNTMVDTVNAKIATVENAVTQANTEVQNAETEITDATADLSDLQTQLNEINDAIDAIEEDLNGAEGIDTAIDNLANQIDKEMVVIATNTGSSAEPYPYGVGTDVGKHSVFLILTTT